MVKLHQIVEGHSGCVFMMIDYICGGQLLDFIHANRHNWEDSQYHQGSPKHCKSSRRDEGYNRITASSYPSHSCDECGIAPRPPVVVDPPTPTDVCSQEAAIHQEVALVAIDKQMDPSSDDRPAHNYNLHFSAASCFDSQQASPVSSLKAGSSSILERKIVQWAAQIIVSLESLHKAGIVCG